MRQLLIVISAMIVMLISGCVPPTKDQLRVDMDLEKMKRRLAAVEVKQAEEVRSVSIGGDNLQRQVAELSAGLDTLRVDFQSINGRIDDLGRENNAARDELQLVKEDLGLRLSSLNERLDNLEQGLAQAPAVQQRTQAVNTTRPAVAAEEQYQQALDLIRNDKKYAEGRKLLEEFVVKYPQHDLYVNALFWTGEALYGEKQYELAILQFQDVISKFKGHSKAPAAMLKQALAFNALGDGANARTTMQKLIENYPDASQVSAAEKYLKAN